MPAFFEKGRRSTLWCWLGSGKSQNCQDRIDRRADSILVLSLVPILYPGPSGIITWSCSKSNVLMSITAAEFVLVCIPKWKAKRLFLEMAWVVLYCLVLTLIFRTNQAVLITPRDDHEFPV